MQNLLVNNAHNVRPSCAPLWSASDFKSSSVRSSTWDTVAQYLHNSVEPILSGDFMATILFMQSFPLSHFFELRVEAANTYTLLSSTPTKIRE